jgi:hypothetical protein
MTDAEILVEALIRVLHVSHYGGQMSVNPGWSYLVDAEMDALRRYMENQDWESYHSIPDTDQIGHKAKDWKPR